MNEDLQVYNNIISARILALETMEKLLCGMLQAMNSEPILLALDAWYLCSDVLVLGHENTKFCLRDPLVAPGGTITIGLEKPGDETRGGLCWSLSLAHLKYYGWPVLISGQMNSGSVRLTMRQYFQAVFRCLLRFWRIRETKWRSAFADWYCSRMLKARLV